jgi:hypothetical protein
MTCSRLGPEAAIQSGALAHPVRTTPHPKLNSNTPTQREQEREITKILSMTFPRKNVFQG